MRAEVIVLNDERNVTLTTYIQEVEGEFGFKKRPAMLVLPGGGYTICSDREADAVAMAYAKAGFQTFILRYTVKAKGKWPLPLDDYEQAMECIKENESTWHVDCDKIAAVGFSAGGHLCACAATLAKNKPAAAILVYPAILKDICDMCQPGMPQPNEYVKADTCPCFLVAARDDRTVAIKNTLMMELALAENNVPFESHIYSYGGHGFSTAAEWIITNSVNERVSKWV
ncbi:MAG: alpha/beta hydrolase, partial [Lachnospiraceae bacterium]|nr:alpha/beta hydrolase [Lachnospiraceae bacterium]